MREINITSNDAGRRLDRFLRKYLKNASLGEIYKLIRKDVKVDGKRRSESYILSGDETLSLYISDEVFDALTGARDNSSARGKAGHANNARRAKRQFTIIYEDDKILIVSKPYGLLTHGDSHEKKNHLANQVKDYLIEKGDFDPRSEKVFSPAPANRLDRNTTGLVLFGKTSSALKALNEIIRDDLADKYYLTIACGTIDSALTLTGSLSKDQKSNKVTIHTDSSADARDIVTVVRPVAPLRFGRSLDATLTEIQLITGRPHQIRAHLASIGHPVVGDSKYADSVSSRDAHSTGMVSASSEDVRRLNEHFFREYHQSAQLLHAYKISFAATDLPEELSYLAGKSFTVPLPASFSKVLAAAGIEASALDEMLHSN